jgi:CheY-like chemotaxis protein
VDEFEQQVRDCLMHLHDYAFLRDHPLVHLLVPESHGIDQMKRFQELVAESVEQLKPTVEVAPDSKPSRLYNLLLLHYVKQRTTREVIDQLALSERQFYRDHPKALQILTRLLWEKVEVVDPPASIDGDPVLTEISVASEVQRSSQYGRVTEIMVDEVLDGAFEVVRSLAAQHQVDIQYQPYDQPPFLSAERTIFRQAVIGILSSLIAGSQSGGRLEINHWGAGRQYQIVFALTSAVSAAADQQSFVLDQTLYHLTTALNAELRCEMRDEGQVQVMLTLPFSQRTVLAIDDNPDVIALFRRYLADGSHRLLAAPNGEQAIGLARTLQPDIILLDIMLSGQDGFEILQNLKHHPATQRIPVLICSVLDAAEVAYSLGANDYMRKPPTRGDFLRALDRWQG